jgi:hypothetical protein
MVGVRVVVGEGTAVTVCVGSRCVGLGGMEVAVDPTYVTYGDGELVTGEAFPHPVISNKNDNAKAIIFFIRVALSSPF